MDHAGTTTPLDRQRDGFTLIELLTVMFLIGLMSAIIAPAVTSIIKEGPKVKTRRAIQAICSALEGYRQDFQQYPPSEPDMVDGSRDSVNSFAYGYYGSAALHLYLNGKDSESYTMLDDQRTYNNPATRNNNTRRRWPARVKGVTVSYEDRAGLDGGSSPTGFLDAWDNDIEYFLAYERRGQTAADIFPRATNYSLDGTSPYLYVHGSSGTKVGGLSILVPVSKWLDDTYNDRRQGWAKHAVPIHANDYLVISSGPDSAFGDENDLGNW